LDDANRALEAWAFDRRVALRSVASGLINRTFDVVDPGGAPLGVLQRLNTAIFRPIVHEDIDAVTARLVERQVPTPVLVRTRVGGLWHEDAEGGVWRVLTPVGDRTVLRLTDRGEARSAGALLARFHAAVRDLRWDFRMVRPGAHDTAAHLRRLADAPARFPDHRLHDAVAALADELTAAWGTWEGPSNLPSRVIHGDLKISNVRFLGAEAFALIDLDTLANGTLDVELGDAFRSWCNPASEDVERPEFDVGLFAAAVGGYARGAGVDGPTDDEWAAILPGIERISIELAARFAADALAESYFGWDPRFGGRGEHNLLRARGQAALARSVRARREEAESALAAARRSGVDG
jgi:Ser/Thr protein kinase RdoA (MazF antagonist)